MTMSLQMEYSAFRVFLMESTVETIADWMLSVLIHHDAKPFSVVVSPKTPQDTITFFVQELQKEEPTAEIQGKVVEAIECVYRVYRFGTGVESALGSLLELIGRFDVSTLFNPLWTLAREGRLKRRVIALGDFSVDCHRALLKTIFALSQIKEEDVQKAIELAQSQAFIPEYSAECVAFLRASPGGLEWICMNFFALVKLEVICGFRLRGEIGKALKMMTPNQIQLVIEQFAVEDYSSDDRVLRCFIGMVEKNGAIIASDSSLTVRVGYCVVEYYLQSRLEFYLKIIEIMGEPALGQSASGDLEHLISPAA